MKKYFLSSFRRSWTRHWYSSNSSHFLNLLKTYVKHVSTIYTGIFSSVKDSSFKEVSVLFCISLLVFVNLSFLNFGLIWTCFFFLQWKLHKFSTWNKKSDGNIISSYFTLNHNGNQPLNNGMWRNAVTLQILLPL